MIIKHKSTRLFKSRCYLLGLVYLILFSCNSNTAHKKTKKDKKRETTEVHAQTEITGFEFKGRNGFIAHLIQNTDSIQDFSDSIQWKLTIHHFKQQARDTSFRSANAKEFRRAVQRLFCLKTHVAPAPPKINYIGSNFVITDAIEGDQFDTTKLCNVVCNAVLKSQKSSDLEAEGCYKYTLYKKDSPKTQAALNSLKNCLRASITYKLGKKELKLTSNDFASWLTTDTAMNMTLDKPKLNAFMKQIFAKFDTVYQTHAFKTTMGTTQQVKGGDVGWRINYFGEINQIKKDLLTGTAITREPMFAIKGLQNSESGVGQTYVEINITKQKLWFYKDNQLVLESDIVTGNTKTINGTPGGVYYVKYKATNATLDGPDYCVHVRYWMPLNGNIGLHDARWRKAFGGNIFQLGGSHGCINLPLKTAEMIFKNSSSGLVVVCYYEG